MYLPPVQFLLANMGYTWTALLLFTFLFNKGIANDCAPYRVENVLVACVCNATYCDGIPENRPEVPKIGRSHWYQSNRDGLRLKWSEVNFNENNQDFSADVTLEIDDVNKYQKIFGFGGAFSGATGFHIASLSSATQEQLMRTYYHPKTGSRYTLGRIPIGSSDFSLRHYTYDDTPNDVQLNNFALTHDDERYKIPFAKRAHSINPDTKFFGAAWTAPEWMKTDNGGLSFLKQEYYQTYANYLMKFLDSYAKHDIRMWALSTGNEPSAAEIFKNSDVTMGWTPETMANWIANNLGPTLTSSRSHDTKIMIFDDDKTTLSEFAKPILRHENSERYVAGIGVHWYKDDESPPTKYTLSKIHNDYPQKFILMTEASNGPPVWNTPNVTTESWLRGEKYFLSILEYMKHWSIGWVDWNLALDQTGGPNLVNLHSDAAIIVNKEKDEFYKQPMYYAIKHFSRFIPRDSQRISITETSTVRATAFLTPLKETVVVLYNRANTTQRVVLHDLRRGNMQVELSPQSMNTFKYK
ncbi:lysosomal acid glucosylceramidase-like [Frieseomelitta varia]|uniref:lysosomal acid glucosylceramidase-like n=1 Tax=Frieseomelitta varia TaxID=561572 RepID=UPI001CB6B525|nr:lysosomal acid glucosylceramidase-like [Frieseomelitta varia]XP_043524014.1 lysosomal acid glucosylceramidase-like [Frieseomelitta varia]